MYRYPLLEHSYPPPIVRNLHKPTKQPPIVIFIIGNPSFYGLGEPTFRRYLPFYFLSPLPREILAREWKSDKIWCSAYDRSWNPPRQLHQVLTPAMKVELDLEAGRFFSIMGMANPGDNLEQSVVRSFLKTVAPSSPSLYVLYNGCREDYGQMFETCVAAYYKGLRLGKILPRYPPVPTKYKP